MLSALKLQPKICKNWLNIFGGTLWKGNCSFCEPIGNQFWYPGPSGKPLNSKLVEKLNRRDNDKSGEPLVRKFNNFNKSSKCDNLFAASTVGCFAEGYILAIPRSHMNSLIHFEWTHGQKGTYLTFVEELRKQVEQIYGPVIVGEHGMSFNSDAIIDSDSVDSDWSTSSAPQNLQVMQGSDWLKSYSSLNLSPTYTDCGSACVDHAHIHFIPLRTSENVQQVVSEYLKVAKPVTIIEPRSCAKEATKSFVDFGDDSYLMLSPEPGKYLIWESIRNFSRQMIRKTAAKILDIEEFYDWRQYPFEENMFDTVMKMQDH